MSAPLAFSEANRKVVSHLYRNALKTSRNWINKRNLWREEALKIRQQFDAQKNVQDPRQIQELIKKTEATLHYYRHPDPIIPPCRQGGTKHERNIHPSLETPVHTPGI